MDPFLSVQGGWGAPIAGAFGPAGLDGRSEWVPIEEAPDLLEAVRARLGSEADPEKILLGVLAPLRPWLQGEALDAILASLPRPVAGELLEAGSVLLAPLPRPDGAGDYLATVVELVQHPPATARAYVLAVFGALDEVLGEDAARSVAARLPPDIAALRDEAG